MNEFSKVKVADVRAYFGKIKDGRLTETIVNPDGCIIRTTERVDPDKLVESRRKLGMDKFMATDSNGNPIYVAGLKEKLAQERKTIQAVKIQNGMVTGRVLTVTPECWEYRNFATELSPKVSREQAREILFGEDAQQEVKTYYANTLGRGRGDEGRV